MNKDLRIQPGAMLASPKLNDVFKRVDRYSILQCKLTFIIMCHYICQNIRGLITLRTSEIENDYIFLRWRRPPRAHGFVILAHVQSLKSSINKKHIAD